MQKTRKRACRAAHRKRKESRRRQSAAFLDEAEESIHHLHSVMLVRHGHVVAEGWWTPYAPAIPHMLYSLSKSFTSPAVGLAVAEGLLSVDDPVL